MIVRSSGGAHTSGDAASATADNHADTIEEHTAAPPELREPTETGDPTPQALPETQQAAPSAASTPTDEPRKNDSENDSDAKEVAQRHADSASATKIDAASMKPQLSNDTTATGPLAATATDSQPADGTVQPTTGPLAATATDSQSADGTVQPTAATFNTLPSIEPEPTAAPTPPSTVISAAAELIGAALEPILAPGPGIPSESPLLWTLAGWVRRESTQALADQTPTISSEQTTQTEPLLAAEETSTDEIELSALAIEQPIDDDTPTDQTKLPAEPEPAALMLAAQETPVEAAAFSALAVAEPLAAAAAVQAGLPAEFERTTLVSGLNQPTDFRFLPDGRILIAEKGGAIKVYANGQLQATR